MACLMLSIFLTFIGDMPLGNFSSFVRSGILFGTEISLKLFVMKPSVRSLVMTSPGF
jgi:hypothetical protein